MEGAISLPEHGAEIQMTLSYHFMSHDYVKGGSPGLELVNQQVLLATTGRGVLGPPSGQRGFPDYPEPPHFRLNRKLGRDLRDLEQYGEYWLVSAKLKDLLEAMAPQACAFCPCLTSLVDDSPGPEYFLCDVLQVLDSVDETRSKVTVKYTKSGRKTYQMSGLVSLVFNLEVTHDHHLFRPAYLTQEVICDDELKRACKAASLKGIKFRETEP